MSRDPGTSKDRMAWYRTMIRIRLFEEAEEDVHAAGWGATFISELTIGGLPWARSPRRVSLPDDPPIPYSPPLEGASLPSVEAIATAARATLGR